MGLAKCKHWEGVVRVRDILRLMTAYVVWPSGICPCGTGSTRPALHGWIGGEDLVYRGMDISLSCVVLFRFAERLIIRRITNG